MNAKACPNSPLLYFGHGGVEGVAEIYADTLLGVGPEFDISVAER